MGNYESRVKKPLSEITGPLIGQDLLPQVKQAMLEQRVFRHLFGEKGERIFVHELPSYNDTIVPAIEFEWKAESWQSQHTRVTGQIGGMIVLPADLHGHTDRFRAIVGAFTRWMESRHNLFERVSGLIEFGKNSSFRYDNAIRAGGTLFPVIDVTLPVLFDLVVFRHQHPEIDLDAPLDSPPIPDSTTYEIEIADENGNVLIPTGVLLKSDSEDEDDG